MPPDAREFAIAESVFISVGRSCRGLCRAADIVGGARVTVFGSGAASDRTGSCRGRSWVVNKAETAADAFEANRAGVGAVRDSLRASGLADDSVEVARVTLETIFDSYESRRRDVPSHRAYVRFRFLMTRLDEVEATLTAAVEAGANEVQVTYQTIWVCTRTSQRTRNRSLQESWSQAV
jgi:uncharacterized protein YggE